MMEILAIYYPELLNADFLTAAAERERVRPLTVPKGTTKRFWRKKVIARVEFWMMFAAIILFSGTALAEENGRQPNEANNYLAAYQCAFEPVFDSEKLKISGLARCSYVSFPGRDENSSRSDDGSDDLTEVKDVPVSLFSVGHEDVGLVTAFGNEALLKSEDCNTLVLKTGVIDEIGPSIRSIEFERAKTVGAEEAWLARRYMPKVTFEKIKAYFENTPSAEKMYLYRECGWHG